MSTYATVRPTFWARGSGKSLRGDAPAQVLALYLMTCQHANVCGIFHIGLPTISHETGLPTGEIMELFSRLEGIAFYDEEEELCFVPNMAKHQIGDELKPNDKRRPKLLRELQQFNGHRFLDEFLSMYAGTYELPINKGLPETKKPLVRSGKVRSGKVKAEKASIPDDWKPTENHYQLAKRERLDCDRMAEAFRAHAVSVGREQKCWNGAFTTWLLSSNRDRDRIQSKDGFRWGSVEK